MVQKYLIVNVTKKQYVDPISFGEGSTLYEFCRGYTMKAVALLFSSEWSRDQVIIAGSYQWSEEDNLYKEAYETYDKLDLQQIDFLLSEIEAHSREFNVIINHTKKEYIHLDHGMDYDEDSLKIALAGLAHLLVHGYNDVLLGKMDTWAGSTVLLGTLLKLSTESWSVKNPILISNLKNYRNITKDMFNLVEVIFPDSF